MMTYYYNRGIMMMYCLKWMSKLQICVSNQGFMQALKNIVAEIIMQLSIIY